MGGAQKSIANNRALRKGRNNLFERKAPKAKFEPGSEVSEVSRQVRRKFREQLKEEIRRERLNNVVTICIYVALILLTLLNMEY